MQRYLLLFFLPYLLIANSFLDDKSDETILQEIHAYYDQQINMGLTNKYMQQKIWVQTMVQARKMQELLQSKVRYVFDVYDEYFYKLREAVAKHPFDKVCIHCGQELESFLEIYDRERIATCFTLFQFAFGNLTLEDNREGLRSIIIEYSIKKNIVQDIYKQDVASATYICEILERKRIDTIRKFCSNSPDKYLKAVLYPELSMIATASDYWNRYTFKPEQPVFITTEGEKEIAQIWEEFRIKIDEVKKQYGWLIGLN